MKEHTFLGLKIHPLSIEELNEKIGEMINKGEKGIVSNHNLHSLYIYHKEKKMKEFYSLSKLIHIDGMSLILLAKLFGIQIQREKRVTYVDWIHPLMKEAAEKKWKVYFIGSKPGIGEKAAEVLKREYPQLMMKTHHGYFSIEQGSHDNLSVLKEIEEYSPNLLLIGMGMPRQEYWVLENYNELKANAILTAGACMDYVAGNVPTPPRWMGRMGLEWLYRLLSEPKRLWKRYLIEPWVILGLIIKYKLNLRNSK